MKKQLPALLLLSAALFTVLAASAAQAGVFDVFKSKGEDPQLAAEIRACKDTLQEFTAKSDSLTRKMLKDAEAVIIFNKSIRAGFIFSGQYAHGVMVAREGGSWSQPAFVRMSGMGLGLQIGGEVGEVVMVVRGRDSLNEILENRFTMGANASAAAGQKGRSVDASTNSQAGILAFGKAKGLFAGMSFDGAVIKVDAGANQKYYGKSLDARRILIDKKAPATAPGAELVAALKRVD